MSRIKCPSCGTLNNDINDWCLSCKSDLKKISKANIPVTVCKICRKLNVGAFQYCVFCGNYLKNIDKASGYDEEELVLVRNVTNLPPEEALFYAKENIRLNKHLYLRKINDLAMQLELYRRKLLDNDTVLKEESIDLDFVAQAVDKAAVSIKNSINSFFTGSHPKEEESKEKEYKNEQPESREKVTREQSTVNGKTEHSGKLNNGNKLDDNLTDKHENNARLQDLYSGSGSEKKDEESIESGFADFSAADKGRAVKDAFNLIVKEKYADNMMFSQVKAKIERKIDYGSKHMPQSSGSQKTAQQTAYLIIASVISEDLSRAGDCYLFKSVLSTKGKELFRAWELAVKELLKSGAYLQSEYDEALKTMNDTVRNNG